MNDEPVNLRINGQKMTKNDQSNQRSCISLENKKGIEIEKVQCSQSMRESME